MTEEFETSTEEGWVGACVVLIGSFLTFASSLIVKHSRALACRMRNYLEIANFVSNYSGERRGEDDKDRDNPTVDSCFRGCQAQGF